MSPLLAHLIAFVEASKYILLFLGSFFEGTAVMMTGGVLWRLGNVQFLPMYAALMAGDFLSDMAWYALGYFGGRRFFMLRWGYFIGATKETMEKVERRFHQYHLNILIISKLTMGFGLAAMILTYAGMLRVSLIRYVIIQLLGGFVWVFFIVVVGYYFGNVLDFVPAQYRFAAVAGVFVVAILILRMLAKRLEKVDW